MVLHKSIPADRGCAVAVIIFILGLGTLLPWNFFITATQYFNGRLKVNGTSENTDDYHYDNWMTLVSQLPLLLFTLLNSFLYQWVTERVRIAVSMTSILLLFVLTACLVKVPMAPKSFFSVTMATIWFINMFGAVLQGSLFGLVGLLPPRYSTLFMSGQGLAGIFSALAMLLSIFSNADKETAALGYFITPCVATLLTLLCYLILPHLEFAQFYLKKSHGQLETTNELIKPAEKGALYKVSGMEKSLVVMENADSQRRSSVQAVFKKIWVMALCVTSVLAVTLSVFPAVTVKVKTIFKESKDWEPYFLCVCCFIVFNVMDLIGRSATSLAQWPSKESRWFPVLVLSRVVFVPLVMLCNVEHSRLPVLFSHDVAFVCIMTLFALSNGYCICLCMTYAPQLVRSKDCETAGALMTFFLALGLSVGAACSFLLGALL
ncbi:equilibrative nucleoside transporter 2-like isoform X1 [Osmerus mordax]|uniref:equilibrative nucleoside transporter 2-like isoform X1 n=1 Tax=Osmerus mordax TaxID=8014 RepID=UPI00350F1DCA